MGPGAAPVVRTETRHGRAGPLGAAAAAPGSAARRGRSFGFGLFVDLVPQSCWFTNVRTCVAAADWNWVRRMVYRRAADRCEACGRGRDPETGVRMEAHERWAFDDARGVQALRRLICLCNGCHGATHFGLANVQGRSA